MIDLLVAQADVVGAATPDLLPSLWRMLGALAVVLALVGGLAWLLRRGAIVRRRATGVGIESAVALGERRSLVIVSVEGRRLLLGLAPGSISLVTELQTKPFEQVLQQASGPEGPSV
jgi:flagellar biosynthetic protein FliO